MVSKGFPNVTTSGRQYNIGEKPSVIYCTLTSISMQGHQNHKLFYRRVPDYSVVIFCTLTLISMQGHQNHNLFYLRVPDYSSVVILFYMVLENRS